MGDKIKKPIVVFLSSPFTGLTEGELETNYSNDVSKLTHVICKHYGVEASDIEIHCAYDKQSMFDDKINHKHEDLYCVGKCISDIISQCDVIAFGHNWRLSLGCRVEQYATSIYGLDYIDLDQSNLYVHYHDQIYHHHHINT